MVAMPDRMTVANNEGTVEYIRSDMVVGQPMAEALAESQRELHAATERVEELEKIVADLRRDGGVVAAELASERAASRDFQKLVRDTAIRVAEEQSWCDQGLNEVLEELGLEPKNKTYRVTVRVFAYQDVETEISAASENQAGEMALDYDQGVVNIWEETEPQAWETTEMFGEGYQIRSIHEL